MSNHKYILELNEEQALLLRKATEFYARMRIGQWNELRWLVLNPKDKDFCKRKDDLEALLLCARKIAYPDLQGVGHSYGIGEFDDADIAWELHMVLRHAIAWTNHPEGGITVDFDAPRSFTGRGIAKCSVVDSGTTSHSDSL